MKIRRLFARPALLITALLVAAPSATGAAAGAKPPLVLAAASLQGSLDAVADAWARQGHPKPIISYAASSALARQVAAGAPADLFASADEPWMDDLQKRGLLAPGTRVDFVGNDLVLIAPVASRTRVSWKPGFAAVLAAGPLAMADPESVPAGKYGKAALTKLGAWPTVAPKVVRAENVRAALALVERGAAPFGIVYGTDARASRAVRVAAVFPATSHAPITYPVARLKGSTNPEGEGFRKFLLSGAARTIFAGYGFRVK
jgi:molybdate transport system substrate-binding protein